MTERLLHYIWQFKYFNSDELRTTGGQVIKIIFPGLYNSNQGPDFLNAKIKVDETTWVGSIEIHNRASEWISHNHSEDENYSNVVLHVVWTEDVRLTLSFPTLELHDRVSSLLLNKYDELMQSPLFIPCQSHVKHINKLVINSCKQRMLIERLQNRALHIEQLLMLSNGHWEEVFWWILARNFGMKVNSDSFEKIAQPIPIKILSKHKQQIHQLECLLLGQAGLLDKQFTDAYPNMLRKEYYFLQKKYGLSKIHYPLYFLRMRPANFPTVRLAQLAMLIRDTSHFLSVIRETESIEEIYKMLDVTANDYWHYHYTIDCNTGFLPKKLGRTMADNILINTIIPVLYAYGYFNNDEKYKLKAITWMEELPAEKNSITQGFEKLLIENQNAFDSQSLIQLKNEYCNYKRCLECAIGNSILQQRN